MVIIDRHRTAGQSLARHRHHSLAHQLRSLEGGVGHLQCSAAQGLHALLTRYDANRAARGEMLKVDDVLEILSIPLIGIIPESEDVLRASNLGTPVTLGSPAGVAARAYQDAVRRLQGETIEVQVPVVEKRSLFGKLFGRRVA